MGKKSGRPRTMPAKQPQPSPQGRFFQVANRDAVIAAIWLVVRLLAIGLALQTLHPIKGWLNDISLYNYWAANIKAGNFPINDEMWQYPPLAAIVFLIGQTLSAALLAVSITNQAVGFIALAVIADALIMGLLLLARRKFQSTRTFGLWLWVATPIIMSPIMFGRFDVFPTMLAVAAVVFASNSRAAGALIAVGTLLKVWPVLGLLGAKRKQMPDLAIAFAGTVILGTLILWIWWPGSFDFLNGQRARGLQIESVGALPYMMWNALGHHVNIASQYGALEIVAQGTQAVCLGISLVGLILIAGLTLLRITGKFPNATAGHITLTAVLLSMVSSRVLSPQYSVWMLGLLAVVAFHPPKLFNWIAAMLIVSAACGNAIYPPLYYGFMAGDWLAMTVQIVRILTLIAGTALCVYSLFLEARSGSIPASKSAKRAKL